MDAIVLPATGVYTILFDPQKAQVGSATFTLYDVPPDVTTTITPNGGTVTVTTTVPGQNGRLSFDALAGRAHSLRLGSTPCCTSKLSVLRPDGTTLISPKRLGGNGGLLEFTPSTDGVHTIMVDPEFHVLGSLPLTLTTAAADITGTIVAGGAAQTLTIGSAGQNARLTFSGATGQRVSATLTGCCAADVSILRADGTVLVPATRLSASGGFLEPKLLPVDGVYTLVIDPVGSATGTLTIRLHDVPPDVTDVLGAGTPSSVTLAAPGQNAKLAFSGTVGDRISVTVSGVTVGGSNCCGVNVSLLSPTGTTLAMVSNVGSSGGFIDAMTLAATGTYTVLVDGIGGQTGDAAVRIDLVASDLEGSVATNGTQTMLTTTTPGQNARFTFTGTAGDGIHVTASALCCQAAVSLLRPDGSRLAGPVTSSSGATLNTRLDVTGVHTVLVDPTGSATGSATVRVQLDNSPPPRRS